MVRREPDCSSDFLPSINTNALRFLPVLLQTLPMVSPETPQVVSLEILRILPLEILRILLLEALRVLSVEALGEPGIFFCEP
ncbi:hypothetical protein ES703_101075 [subsurface metagenome]